MESRERAREAQQELRHSNLPSDDRFAYQNSIANMGESYKRTIKLKVRKPCVRSRLMDHVHSKNTNLRSKEKQSLESQMLEEIASIEREIEGVKKRESKALWQMETEIKEKRKELEAHLKVKEMHDRRRDVPLS